MPAEQRGSAYKVRGGYGVRWYEGDRREYYAPRPPFPTKVDARRWFADNVAGRLQSRAPHVGRDKTLRDFAELFLQAHAADVDARTIRTLRERLKRPLERFGDVTLGELEWSDDELSAWRASVPEGYRPKVVGALAQVLELAVERRYIAHNPARSRRRRGRRKVAPRPEIVPFTHAEIDLLAGELAGDGGPLVVFAAETGLRPEEWIALEWADLDLRDRAVDVRRAFSDGRLKHLKTEDSYRQVPLSLRAIEALESLPRRIDGRQLVFAAAEGSHLNLGNFRRRDWYPALVAGGFVHCPHNPRHPAKREGRRYVCQQPTCGGAALAHRLYDLRHTFASWSLAAGATIFELSRFMGASPRVIELYYGHLVRESAVSFRDKLDAYATTAIEASKTADGRNR